MAPIKKFSVKTVGSDQPIEVTLGFAYTHFFLVLPHQADVESDDVLQTTRVTTTLNSVSHSLSFVPPNTQTGARRFFMKTYTENEGLLEQLMDLKILKKTGIQIEGLPVVEVQLEESELAHACAYHYDQQGLVDARFELAEPGEGKEVVRYQRCSKCKEMYYCSQEVTPFQCICVLCSSIPVNTVPSQTLGNAQI
jgi:hypothetical protein